MFPCEPTSNVVPSTATSQPNESPSVASLAVSLSDKFQAPRAAEKRYAEPGFGGAGGVLKSSLWLHIPINALSPLNATDWPNWSYATPSSGKSLCVCG